MSKTFLGRTATEVCLIRILMDEFYDVITGFFDFMGLVVVDGDETIQNFFKSWHAMGIFGRKVCATIKRFFFWG